MSYDLKAHAESGNRFAGIVYAALLYRQGIAMKHAQREIERLRKRAAWRTPDGPRKEVDQEGAG